MPIASDLYTITLWEAEFRIQVYCQYILNYHRVVVLLVCKMIKVSRTEMKDQSLAGVSSCYASCHHYRLAAAELNLSGKQISAGKFTAEMLAWVVYSSRSKGLTRMFFREIHYMTKSAVSLVAFPGHTCLQALVRHYRADI